MKRRQLQRDLDRALAALAYYGSEETWQRFGIHEQGQPKRFAPAPYTFDHGRLARHVLAVSARKLPPSRAVRGLWRTFLARVRRGASIPAEG